MYLDSSRMGNNCSPYTNHLTNVKTIISQIKLDTQRPSGPQHQRSFLSEYCRMRLISFGTTSGQASRKQFTRESKKSNEKCLIKEHTIVIEIFCSSHVRKG